MNKQINVRFPMKLLQEATTYAQKRGYGTVQEFVKECVRQKLYDPELSEDDIDKIEHSIHQSKRMSLQEFKARAKKISNRTN